MTYNTLLFSADQGIARVTLNRPQVLHALNTEMFDELDHVFQHLASESDIRVVLLTGAGEKAFAAGADIRELQEVDARSGEQKSLRGQTVFSQIESCGKPVLALVNGFALGGGCELSMACTLRIAADTAKFRPAGGQAWSHSWLRRNTTASPFGGSVCRAATALDGREHRSRRGTSSRARRRSCTRK